MAFSSTRMLMAAAGVSVIPPVSGAAFFDDSATASQLSINGTSLTASSTGIMSIWVDITAFSGSNTKPLLLDSTMGNISIVLNNTNSKITILLADTGSNIYQITTTTATISTGAWHNILLSWNMGFSAGSRVFNLYIDNVSAAFTINTDSGTSFNVAYNTNYQIGSTNTAKGINGCITQLYFAAGQFLDFTVSGNRALFYNSGTPVNLGSNGQTPTGTSPSIFWPGNFNNLSNLGALGGSFTATGDALTNCTSYP